jgi:hypothetical protein
LVLITIFLIIYIVEITVSISYQAYKKLKWMGELQLF